MNFAVGQVQDAGLIFLSAMARFTVRGPRGRQASRCLQRWHGLRGGLAAPPRGRDEDIPRGNRTERTKIDGRRRSRGGAYWTMRAHGLRGAGSRHRREGATWIVRGWATWIVREGATERTKTDGSRRRRGCRAPRGRVGARRRGRRRGSSEGAVDVGTEGCRFPRGRRASPARIRGRSTRSPASSAAPRGRAGTAGRARRRARRTSRSRGAARRPETERRVESRVATVDSPSGRVPPRGCHRG